MRIREKQEKTFSLLYVKVLKRRGEREKMKKKRVPRNI
jgi:hypothetical protein